MLILFFCRFSTQAMNADLTPPFISFDNKQIGVWTVSGVSIIYQNYILLTPPLQYHRGSVWSSVQVPSGDWSMQIELTVSEGNGGGGFGIWLIEEFGKDGRLNGGPTEFNGISIVGDVNQSNVNLRFLSEQIETNATVEIFNGMLILYLQFSSSEIKVASFHPTTKKFTLLMNINKTFDLSLNSIGITAQSDEYTSLITLRSVTFHINDEKKELKKRENIKSINNSNQPHFQPKIVHRLRNPLFLSTRTEILQLEKMEGSLDKVEPTKVTHVLNVIDEINEVSFGVASFTDLNLFVRNTIVPYTENWGRRTSKILDYVGNAKTVTVEACSIAHKIAVDFSHIKNMSFEKVENSFNSIQKEFENNLLISNAIDPEALKKEFQEIYISEVLSAVAIMEIFIFLLLGLPCTVKCLRNLHKDKHHD